MRGVPRARRAIASAPPGAIGAPRMAAERLMIAVRSSPE